MCCAAVGATIGSWPSNAFMPKLKVLLLAVLNCLPCLFVPQLQDVREYNKDAEPLGVIAAQASASRNRPACTCSVLSGHGPLPLPLCWGTHTCLLPAVYERHFLYCMGCMGCILDLAHSSAVQEEVESEPEELTDEGAPMMLQWV